MDHYNYGSSNSVNSLI